LKSEKVIGWFQGRMEWGPRALGNRSILADPRRADMKDILNAKIKRRESFRPFAPSILREHVAEWFEQDDDVPYMMEVFQFREDAGVMHAALFVQSRDRLGAHFLCAGDFVGEGPDVADRQRPGAGE